MRFHTLDLAGIRLVTALALALPLVLAPGCGGDESEDGTSSGSGGGSGSSDGMGGGAASGGSGGTVTTNSGGSSNDMKLLGPIERDGKLVLEFGETYLEIDPKGGRVLSLRQDGRELFTDSTVNASNFGSTFWTSPQSDWGWPPNPYVDVIAYAVTVGDASVTLKSQEADVGTAVGGKHVTVTKRFTADVEREAIDIEYTLTNVGDEAISLAGWEISRVAGGGLTFYPTGSTELTPVDPPHPGTIEVTHSSDITWFDHSAFTPGENAKLNADGVGGWLAHVTNGVLLLKTFPDVAPSEQAPGEGEIEIFADTTGDYVEVENQGPYVSIEPGASSTYKVTWLVRKLPEGVEATAGSASLLSFVQSLK